MIKTEKRRRGGKQEKTPWFQPSISSRNEEKRANRLRKISSQAVAAETVISLFIPLLDFKCQVVRLRNSDGIINSNFLLQECNSTNG